MAGWGGSTVRAARLAILLGSTSLAGVLSLPQVFAQTTAPTTGVFQRSIAFAIPPQSLSSGIVAFSRAAGVDLVFDGAVPRNARTQGASGTFTVREGVNQLLAGTGLSARFSGARTVQIFDPSKPMAAGAQPAGTIALDTIDVQTNSDGAVGYVATRSISGTKTNTSLVETPQAISVVTRKQIEDQAAQSVPQALRYTSGVVPETRAAWTTYDFLFVRGFSIPQYLDGMRLLGGYQATPQIDAYNLEHIDIVHGPSSVLYGQIAPGGLANLVSKRPTATPYHEIGIQTGSYGNIEGTFDLSGPIDKDGRFLYRLTGLGLSTGTQVDYAKQQRVSISPALTWKPDGDTTLTILSNYQNDPKPGFYNFLPAKGTVLPNPLGRIPTSFYPGQPDYDTYRREQESIGYLFEHRFSDNWTVRQNVRYMHIDSSYNLVYGSVLQPDNQTLTRYPQMDREHFDGITVDNQVQASFDTGPFQHTALFGLDYLHGDSDQRYGFGTAQPINVFNPIYLGPTSYPTASTSSRQIAEQAGLYAQDQMKIDRLRLSIGGREDWASTNTHNRISNVETDMFDRAFTWRAGALYLFDNGIAPYASYSTSFQPTSGADISGNPFKPTTGQQEEVGLKYQPTGSASFFTASLFNLTQQNVLTVDPSNPTFSVQTGEIRSRGLELEAHVNLSDALDVVASYTYQDVVNTKSNSTATGIDGVMASIIGKWPVSIPANSAALWANYKFNEGALAGFGVGGGVRYIGATYGDQANSFEVPGYALVDLALSYDFGKLRSEMRGWQAQLNVTNLFDDVHVASCTDTNHCYYGLRRAILASLKYRW